MEYRFYGFGNYYLSSLQQGLQSAHCVSELFVEHANHQKKLHHVFEWAKNHKTMVLLNGGNAFSLSEIYRFFGELSGEGMDLPFVKFNEDEVSLNGALTYVGIVVTQDIYDMASSMRRGAYEGDKNSWKYKLAVKLNEFNLAH